jgi:hypothetical protein
MYLEKYFIVVNYLFEKAKNYKDIQEYKPNYNIQQRIAISLRIKKKSTSSTQITS